MVELNHNDPALVQLILDTVKSLDVSVYIKTIDRMRLDNPSDTFSCGYDEALTDVIAVLKGER